MNSSYKQPHSSEYVNQTFTYRLGKLSGKGYSTNHRIFKLDANHLSYFSKVPKVFKNTTNKASDLPQGKPKAILKLTKITAIKPLSQDEAIKGNKKLKGQHEKTIRIVFLKDKSFSKTADSDSDLEHDQNKGDAENSKRESFQKQNAKKDKEKIKEVKKLQWVLFCESMKERDILVSQLFMNTKNKQDLMTQYGGNQVLEESPATLDILEAYINHQEENNIQVILNPKSPLKVKKDKNSNDDSESEEDSYEEEPAVHGGLSSGQSDPELDENGNRRPPTGNDNENDQLPLFDSELDPKIKAILHQNLSIAGNKLKDSSPSKTNKPQNQRSSKKEMTPSEAETLKTEIDEILKRQKQTEKDLYDKESQGWNLKFQNYWGQIVAADSFEQNLIMCEKFFKHIGQFRQHATIQMIKIVEAMHEPKQNNKKLAKRNVKELELLKPLTTIEPNQKVFLDEDDNQNETQLYFSGPGKREIEEKNRDGGNSPDAIEKPALTSGKEKEREKKEQTAHIFSQDYILYKFTHKDELVYTKSTDGSTNSNPGKYVTQNQGNFEAGGGQVGSFDIVSNLQSHKNQTSQGGATTYKSLDKSHTLRLLKGEHNQKMIEKWKLYSRQFLSMDVMFEALFVLSKSDADPKVRVPISCLIDYKGFRCLAYGLIPIQTKLGPALGFYKGEYQSNSVQGLKQHFTNVGEILNLKSNKMGSNKINSNEDLPVSIYAKIYESADNLDIKLDNNNNKDSAKQKSNVHSTELEYMEKPCYVLQTSEIFPLDAEQTDSKYDIKNIQDVFRPEFIGNHDHDLKSDTLKDFSGFPVDFRDGKIEISEASKFLKTHVIRNLVDQLDDLSIMPIDTESLQHVFHEHGINMRYLSHVVVLSQVPHVREICVTEMLARTCKNIINYQLSQIILENKEDHKQLKAVLKQKDKILGEKVNLKNKNFKPNKNGGRDESKEYEDAELRWEIQQHQDDQIKITDEINVRTTIDMNMKTHELIVDLFNLIFGRSEETDQFWEFCLIDECKSYFKIQEAMRYHLFQQGIEEIIDKKKVNLNALFYAVCTLVGITIDPLAETRNQDGQEKGSQQYQYKLTKKMDEYFTKFGKAERPFGNPEEEWEKFKLIPKTKCYKLRNIPYTKLFEKQQEYKNQQKIKEALECAKMKKEMNFALTGKIDLVALADIAEMALEQDENELAIQYAEQAFSDIMPLHAERIRFYCVLIRAYYSMDNFKESERYFQIATDTLFHHLGPSHPLHMTVYGLMAYLLVPKGKYEEAMYLYKSSLLCCMKVLGPNHIQTAQIHMDFGHFYIKWDKRDQALQHFEQAYMVYDNYFTNKQLQKNSVLSADAAMQVANILESQNRLKEAYEYIQIACQTYSELYGDSNDTTIISKWLKLQVAYTKSDGKSNFVVDMADNLFKSLKQREDDLIEKYYKQISANEDIDVETKNRLIYQGYSNADELKEEMSKIQIMCIATHIMEMTRLLSSKNKLLLENFLDNIMLNKYQQDQDGNQGQVLKTLLEYKNKNIDQNNVKKVSGLIFKEDDEKWLKSLYKKTKNSEQYINFRQFYNEMVNKAISQEKGQKDNQKALQSLEKKKNEQLERQDELAGNGGIALAAQKKILILEEAATKDETQEFFEQILDAFKSINFYNLLHWNHIDYQKKEKEEKV